MGLVAGARLRLVIDLVLWLWRAWQRGIDTLLLWPPIRDGAAERGMTLPQAREAFMLHAEGDRAWTSLGEDEMRRRVDGLT